MRGLLLLEGQTANEMEWVLEEITADVTECTVKGLVVANETERTMESVLQWVMQCAAMELTVNAMELTMEEVVVSITVAAVFGLQLR